MSWFIGIILLCIGAAIGVTVMALIAASKAETPNTDGIFCADEGADR